MTAEEFIKLISDVANETRMLDDDDDDDDVSYCPRCKAVKFKGSPTTHNPTCARRVAREARKELMLGGLSKLLAGLRKEK